MQRLLQGVEEEACLRAVLARQPTILRA